LFFSPIWAGDRNGPIYELDGRSFKKIAESPPTNAGEVRAIVDCPIGDGLIVRPSGIFRKIDAARFIAKKLCYIRGKMDIGEVSSRLSAK
jgi:hypothetical protein